MLNSIPEKLLRLTMEKFLPILAFFLFLAAFLVVVSLILSFITRYAWSAPFLVCDPYPATGQQPAEFVVTISGLTAPVITPAVETPQGKNAAAGFRPTRSVRLTTDHSEGPQRLGDVSRQQPFYLYRWASGVSYWYYLIGHRVRVPR